MSLRKSMAGLHTWGGLLPLWLLFVVLFSGTLACFDKELERWMRPELHRAAEAQMGAEDVRQWLQENVEARLHAYWMHPPTAREPYWQLGWEEDESGVRGRRLFDPASGAVLSDTLGGNFFFSLHYQLHAGTFGMYLVGLAGMFMLVALVSGVIIHKRIFKDFFTLRPTAGGQRAWLDAHNLSGVIGLPFHLLMAYTGVAIFVASYMPAGVQVAYAGSPLQFFGEVAGGYHREELGRPGGTPVALDRLLADAGRRWDGGEPGWIIVEHPDDASAVVDIRRRDPSRIGSPQQTLSYDAFDGRLLHQQQPSSAYRAYIWLAGLHMAQFGDSLVRWLYFILGLAGCGMLVGGVQVWLRKREARGGAGLGWVRGLNLAVLGGFPLACLVLLWANRLLPAQWPARAELEGWAFVLAWLGVAGWALLRRGAASGRTLAWLGALLALGLPLLNLLRAPQGHLLASLARDDWALAGIDLGLLLVGLLCLAWARRRALQPQTGMLHEVRP